MIKSILSSKFIGENWYKFTAGWGMITLVMGAFFTFTTWAKVWQPTFDYYGIPYVPVIATGFFIMLVAGWILGDFWIRKNMVAHQTSLLNKNNPEFEKVCQQLDYVYKKLKEEEKRK